MSQSETYDVDLKRIEQKLDAIMNHFDIGLIPRRSNQSIENWAKKKVFDLNAKRKKKAEDGH